MFGFYHFKRHAKVQYVRDLAPLHLESASARGFALLFLVLWTRPSQYLEKVGRPPAHPRMNICLAKSVFRNTQQFKYEMPYLRGLDVIMEVVAESLDVRDDLFPSLSGEMPGK